MLANTIGKWCEKIVAQDLGEQGQLWHPLSFAGRKRRGTMDSFMLMDEIRKRSGGDGIWERYQASFYFDRKAEGTRVTRDLPDIQAWVEERRKFEMKTHGRSLGTVTITQGTPQGSPLRPAIFSIYMITEAQRDMEKWVTRSNADAVEFR